MDEHGSHCTICEEQYNDQRNPRALSCGHSFCSICLNQLFVQNSRHCPECRTHIRNASVNDIPVNYSLLRLVRAQAAQTPKSAPKPGVNPNGGECQAHGNIMFFWCVKCFTWVCRDCLVLDHPESPRGTCVIKASEQATADMIETDNRKVTGLILEIEKIIKMMESGKLYLENQKKQTENKISALQKQIVTLETSFQGYTDKEQEVNKNVTDMKTWIVKLQESMVQTAKAVTPQEAKDILSDMSTSRKDIEEEIRNKKQLALTLNNLDSMTMRRMRGSRFGHSFEQSQFLDLKWTSMSKT
ncbi:tripartite motif-containing protein 65-like [Penaeus chinensis]|uniref:tripartite motif-containing protein 65-like n=1 Tax=Penaeus chinensis TaxID=139456 RepID=UPI001FB6DBC0|nr:tripartite motif-containing protein 65-like [Penaeus chinensis]